ncbi:MAG: Arc family DNA-binding protein [Pseudomonadota bacterium]|nr:Arc family DNA-binding protein [Pseudomonadota bacterium]
MTDIILIGLNGGNPLAYLAALGAFRTSSLQWPKVPIRMAWEQDTGGWHPRLNLGIEISEDEWLAGISSALRSMVGHPALALADDLAIPCAHFRNAALAAQTAAKPKDRCFADFIAAFGSEIVETKENGKTTGKISDTAFRTMSGSGHQHFLGTMRTFVNDTEDTHLRKAVFAPWYYDDPIEKHTMRWDPIDDVRYALQWRNPSGDPERKEGGSMWGANRLAIEALPLLPTAPRGKDLETTGFTRRREQGLAWTWPTWSGALSLDTVRSLLALPALQEQSPDRKKLGAVGVVEVYRCQRITQGKFRNFTPALPPELHRKLKEQAAQHHRSMTKEVLTLLERALGEKRRSKGNPRVLGRDAGLFEVPDDFNAPLPEDLLNEFER